MRHLEAAGLHRAPFAAVVQEDRIVVVDVDDDRAGDAEPAELFHAALRSVEAHVAHAAPGFLAGPLRDHLLVREERAVEEEERGAGELRCERLRYRRAVRDVEEACLTGAELEADRVAFRLEQLVLRRLGLEIERELAGDGKGTNLDPGVGPVAIADRLPFGSAQRTA